MRLGRGKKRKMRGGGKVTAKLKSCSGNETIESEGNEDEGGEKRNKNEEEEEKERERKNKRTRKSYC